MNFHLPLLFALLLLIQTNAAVGPITPDAHPSTRLKEAIRRMRLSLDRELLYLARLESGQAPSTVPHRVAQTTDQDDGFTAEVNDGEGIFSPIRPGSSVPRADEFGDGSPEPVPPTETPEPTSSPGSTAGPVDPTQTPELPISPPSPGTTTVPRETPPSVSETPAEETESPIEIPNPPPAESDSPGGPVGSARPRPSGSALPSASSIPRRPKKRTPSPEPSQIPPLASQSADVSPSQIPLASQSADVSPFPSGSQFPIPSESEFPFPSESTFPFPTEGQTPEESDLPVGPNNNSEGETPQPSAVENTDANESPTLSPPVSASPEASGGVCFPAHATVEMEDGSLKKMADVQLGDRVRVGPSEFSEVFMFTHKLSDVRHKFVDLQTESGHRLFLTKGHYLYVNGVIAAAGSVRIGDSLVLADHSVSAVVSVDTIMARGLYNPQTAHGDVIVNGVRTTTYTTAVEMSIAHSLLAPLRAVYSTFGWSLSTLDTGSDRLASLVPSGSLVL